MSAVGSSKCNRRESLGKYDLHEQIAMLDSDPEEPQGFKLRDKNPHSFLNYGLRFGRKSWDRAKR